MTDNIPKPRPPKPPRFRKPKPPVIPPAVWEAVCANIPELQDIPQTDAFEHLQSNMGRYIKIIEAVAKEATRMRLLQVALDCYKFLTAVAMQFTKPTRAMEFHDPFQPRQLEHHNFSETSTEELRKMPAPLATERKLQ